MNETPNISDDSDDQPLSKPQQESLKIQYSMDGYDRGARDATDSLSKRITALEILLQQKDMRIRHLEERLKERGDTMRIKKEPFNPKDEQ